MKVKKLIKELRKLNPNWDVLIKTRDPDNEGNLWNYDISHIVKQFECDGKTLVEFKGNLNENHLEDLSKDDIRQIVLRKPSYVIIPD